MKVLERTVLVAVLLVCGCGETPKPEVVVKVEQPLVDPRTPDQIAAIAAKNSLKDDEAKNKIRDQVEALDSEQKMEDRLKEIADEIDRVAAGGEPTTAVELLRFESELIRPIHRERKNRRLKFIAEHGSKSE